MLQRPLLLTVLLALPLAWTRPAPAQDLAGTNAVVRDTPIKIGPDDWPWWRGLGRNGVAADGQTPPITWGTTSNVAWKVAIPGRGHGSPSVLGPHVFIATANPTAETQTVFCFDRETGKRVWETVVHRGPLEKRGNAKSSQASCTPACDGQKLYVNFLHKGAVVTSALDLSGRIIWQTTVTNYQTHQGFSSSPCLFGSLVLVSADNRAGGVVVGMSRATGQVAWKQQRPKKANYTSPIVFKVAGRDQALMVGTNLVSSYDPRTGKKLWEIDGATTECVTSVVSDGTRIFTSGGYPRNHVQAILADGSGTTAWQNTQRVYVPSMVAHDKTLYAVLDTGIAVAWDTVTGNTLWKKRLGGTFTSSLVLAAGNLYATDESGQTTVFAASRKGLDIKAKNRLGQQTYSSMAICNSRIFHRVAMTNTSDGSRNEWLYCLKP
jgi:outer membrane protein assembly factor BamB